MIVLWLLILLINSCLAVCPAGSYLIQSYCLSCPPGYHSSGSDSNICIPCPVNTFSSDNKTICLSCPMNSDTRLLTGMSKCISCYQPNCIPCLKGFYPETINGSIRCINCPPKKTNNPMNGIIECNITCSSYDCIYSQQELHDFFNSSYPIINAPPPTSTLQPIPLMSTLGWVFMGLTIFFVIVSILFCVGIYQKHKINFNRELSKLKEDDEFSLHDKKGTFGNNDTIIEDKEVRTKTKLGSKIGSISGEIYSTGGKFQLV